MTDYIREAVKLAGWLDDDDEGEYLQIPDTPVSAYLDEIDAPVYQYLLDALAMQLCRQVDKHHELKVRKHDAYVCSALVDGGNVICRHEGPDRAMNIIRAVVDSGVLK